MKKIIILIFTILFSSYSFADHNNEKYIEDFDWWGFYHVKGSENYLKLESDLIKDESVSKEIDNSDKTGLISYLLFKDNKIIVDESNLPNEIKKNKGLLLSNSVGKSVVSYITGHAICEGYIGSVDVTLDDWSILDNTLYKGQKLIDFLNMSEGAQKYVGKGGDVNRTGDLHKGTVTGRKNPNTIPVETIMLQIFQGSKKTTKRYSYNHLSPNIVLQYVIYKTGDDFQKLLNKIFNEHVKVKDGFYLKRNELRSYVNVNGVYSFHATRYDYLRIAIAMLNDWNNDTCVGKYLKTVYERRITKNENRNFAEINQRGRHDTFRYTRKFGGFFHFDIVGLEKRKILGMNGLGGQEVIIDFDNNKIITIHSISEHWKWKEIVYKKLKED